MKSITITGIDGFVGKHIARAATRAGLKVTGVSRADTLAPDLEEFVDSYFSCDLTKSFPEEALSESIVHLAGLAAVGPSFSNPQVYINANSSMVTNICETVIRISAEKNTKLLAVSTGAVYKPQLGNTPLTESSEIQFSSPYVISKSLVESQISYYVNRGLSAIAARPFNHIGPGQSKGFLIPDLLDRLISLSYGEALPVGNLNTSRDYLDVRDVADAYLKLLALSGWKHDIYNVSSGIATSGNQILNSLCEQGNFSKPKLSIDESLYRPNDSPYIAGDSQRLREETGWQPKFSLQETIHDIVNQRMQSK